MSASNTVYIKDAFPPLFNLRRNYLVDKSGHAEAAKTSLVQIANDAKLADNYADPVPVNKEHFLEALHAYKSHIDNPAKPDKVSGKDVGMLMVFLANLDRVFNLHKSSSDPDIHNELEKLRDSMKEPLIAISKMVIGAIDGQEISQYFTERWGVKLDGAVPVEA